jgi:hypothetical protein
VDCVLMCRRQEGSQNVDRYCELAVPTVRDLPPLTCTVNTALSYNMSSLFSDPFLPYILHFMIYVNAFLTCICLRSRLFRMTLEI